MRITPTGLFREPGESAEAFIQAHVRAQIDDKLPQSPFVIEGHEDIESHPLEGRRWDWFTVCSYMNCLHDKAKQKQRAELWERMKAGRYEVRNRWGVIVGVEFPA